MSYAKRMEENDNVADAIPALLAPIAIPVSQVEVITSDWCMSQGKRQPTGYGGWAFGIGRRNPAMENVFWAKGTMPDGRVFGSMNYGEAKKLAVREAARLGISTVWVLS